MIFHQIGGQNKLTLWNKISLILWVGISLALLSFFTFTFFIIALIVGVVLFILNFFRSGPSSINYTHENRNPPFPGQNYRPKPPKDDDIIDI
jgi:hypothetical protein